jgi:glycosyltransferase involved in cell wall biosynthesis
VNIWWHGNAEQLSSFSLINRHLVAGLRAAGCDVHLLPSDSAHPQVPGERPDVYVFHGHPYDMVSAPGRHNIFIFNYEYPILKAQDEGLVEALNQRFDLVLASTRFAVSILPRLGISTPAGLLPWGFDPTEFEVGAAPGSAAFTFLYLGAVNHRKGTDVLLDAYRTEFQAHEPVRLVIRESMRHRGFAAWAAHLQASLREDGPQVEWIVGATDSVAGFYRQADVGVFPTRGEGFGLPILECMACGTPVIVTRGTGPDDFCTPENAAMLEADSQEGELEPRLSHLRILLRQAFERGRADEGRRQAVARSVASFTWAASLAALEQVLSNLPEPRTAASPGHVRGPAGSASWQRQAEHVGRALRRSRPDLLVGQSQYCAEAFLHGGTRFKVLYRDGAMFDVMRNATNEERTACGLPPLTETALLRWRTRQEARLADMVVLPSHASARLSEAWVDAAKVHVLHPGIGVRPRPAPPRGHRVRFLFWAGAAFRKGVRVLLQAWDQARPDAELWLMTDREILQSRLILSLLTRHPSVQWRPLHGTGRVWQQCDCLVLPALEDGFSAVVSGGMGYGRPAIVSTGSGLSDIIQDGVNGWVVPAGSVEALAHALGRATDPTSVAQAGEAAWETVRPMSWHRYRTAWWDLVCRTQPEIR